MATALAESLPDTAAKGDVEDRDRPAFSGGFLTVLRVKLEPRGKVPCVFWKNVQARWLVVLHLSFGDGDCLPLVASLP